jgi:hypothetical protein
MSESTRNIRLGGDADFRGVDKDTLTRRYAILRRVWTLSNEELQWTTASFLRKTTAGHLDDLIDTDHDWKDRIEYNNKLYDLEFIDCGIDWLKNNEDAQLILSGRENSGANFYCFLVKRVIGHFPGLEKVREL